MLSIINPATGETLESLEATPIEALAERVDQARRAQRDWATTPYEARAAIVVRFRELVDQELEDLARTLSLETGKPLAQSRNELRGFLTRIDYFLETTPRLLHDETLTEADETREILRREPHGVVACISAWNYPYFVGGNVYVPALLTGNAVLYKPSELALLSGRRVAHLWAQAGLPPHVFEFVVGDGQVGKALLDQRLDAAFFTGSYETGVRIATQLAPRLIPLQLELGGKDPAYVTAEVDVASAAAAVADGAFYNAGQSCCGVERVYVHESIAGPFVEAFVEAARQLVPGDPLDPATTLGPLARRDVQIAHLTDQVADARAKGGTVLLGGSPLERPGWFFEPTVVTQATPEMLLMRDESFGPVIGIQTVRDDEDAIERMLDSEYGLTAAVYCRDPSRGEAILSRLPVGTAYVNCCDRVSPRLPWSGRRRSGLGRTLGTDGILAMTVPKAWHVRSAGY